MDMQKHSIILALLLSAYVIHTTCQISGQNAINQPDYLQLSAGSEQFALDLFRRVSAEVEQHNYDFMISPFSIWALLVITAEGARGNTLQQFQNVLRINKNFTLVRDGYSRIQNALNVNTSTVEVTALQALFSNTNSPIDPVYQRDLHTFYNTDLIPLNFRQTYEAQQSMNNYVKQTTKGLIDYLVDEKDLINAQLVLISTIFFKGQWKIPFNRSLTKENEVFYDENSQPIATVNMMYQKGSFPFTAIARIDSHVLELPYGNENRLAMIILLPKKGVTLTEVIEKVMNYGIANIYTELRKAEAEYEDDEVEVYLPRFSTTSDFVMNIILEQMGILDAFDEKRSDLSKISSNPLYISQIFHKTKIEVTEEGTVASAATSGIFANKATPPRFYVNRPFAYIILEKSSNSLVFCGQVRKPEKF